MPNLPISQLPYLSGLTNSTLFAVVYSGDGSPVTYQITTLDMLKSQPFGTVYQSIIPDVTDTYSLGDSAHTFSSIHVGAGTVFIGPEGALGIDDDGILYSINGFATPFLTIGNVTQDGIITTSGITLTVVNDELLFTPISGSPITYNISQQLIPATTGNTNYVLSKTGTTEFAWGWVEFTGGTSGTSGTSGISGSSGTSGISGTNGSSGTSGISGTNGSSGTSGTNGTNGSSGTSGINGTNGSSGTSGISGTSGSSGSSGISGTSGSSGSSGISPSGTGYYGAFYDGGTQSLLALNTPQVMSANTTTHSNGVVLSASTRFVALNTGTYNLQFSAQLNKTSSGTDEVAIWFRKNGVDIPYSNTEMQVAKQGSTGKLVASWNYVDVLNANEYFEIVWASADNTYELLYQPAQTTPYNKPETPSIIVTLTQV